MNTLKQLKRSLTSKLQVSKIVHPGRVVIILLAILMGVLTGLALQCWAPQGLCTFLNDNVFTLVYEAFLSVLKMMIAPLILFSIISSISNMSDITTLGRMGAKLMTSYLVTTTFACLLGLGFGALVSGFIVPVSLTAEPDMVIQSVTPTFKGLVLGMIPHDLVTPVANGDMLKLLFIAVFAGVSMSLMGDHVKLVRELVEQLNALSVKMVSLLMRLMPVVAYCAMASTFISTDISVLGTCAFILLCTLVGHVVMVGVYALMLPAVGRLSPMPFFHHLGQVMIVPFSTSSSAASLPNTMNVCDQLGVSKSVSSFTLPVGATMNMPGCAFAIPAVACILSAAAGLHINPHDLPELIITTIVIITAIPGLPGGFIVLMGMIMELAGIPMAYLTLIIAANPILDPILTTTNVTGDMAVTVMLAGNEGEIDKAKYV